MKKISQKYCLLIFFFMVFLINASAQQAKSTSIGYVDNYANLPKIKFEQSNETEYNRYKKVSNLVKAKVEENKTHFTLPTKFKKIKLKKTNQEQNDFDGYEYLGYYQRLKMYAFTENSSAENLTFSSFGLLDSLTAHYYSIISIGDGAVENPIPSVNSKYLVYYYNLAYKANSCFIGLLKVNIEGKPEQRLKEKMSFETDNFAVEEIKWVNDQCFMVKTYQTNKVGDQRVKTFTYYKANVE
ncbi:hypothetical protein GJU39_10620 [Pedobacter petrophilus]|uniref:Uncharacterized protein n=1 Tax=Pedobacter petrophilus TaxID=1908241 RepID=A0A7K0FYC8_9SPHI|nr:hypothetical protein [Pedobacter petrophilus]MRX76545.1 hypothetical protein [Pedobacter petrophilus]